MRYESNKSQEGLLKERITSIAHEKRRYGYRRIHVLLKREGIKINHKKLFRIYKQLGLKVLKRGGRKGIGNEGGCNGTNKKESGVVAGFCA